MFKQLLSLLLISICTAGFSQWDQTDYFDFGEDRSSHDYVESGSVSIGAYECTGTQSTTTGEDSTIRVGTCSNAGEIQLTLAVTEGADSVNVLMPTPVYPEGDVYFDDVFVGKFREFNPGDYCDSLWHKVGGLTANTADGEIVMRIVAQGACQDNPQPAYIIIASKQAEPVYYQDYLLTDYFNFGEDRSSHNYSESGTVSMGAYECTGTQSTTTGEDQTIRMGNCGSGGGEVELTLQVLPDVDSIIILMPTPVYPDGAVYLDNMQIDDFRTINPDPHCSENYFRVGGLQTITDDGEIVLRIVGEADCTLNPQPTYVKIYSKDPDVITSVHETIPSSGVTVFPNPSNGLFQFEGEHISGYAVIDAHGQLILQQTVDGSSSHAFHIQDAGVYTVVFQHGNTVSVEKVVKY